MAGAVQLTMSSIESDQAELANDPSKTLIVIFTGCQVCMLNSETGFINVNISIFVDFH